MQPAVRGKLLKETLVGGGSDASSVVCGTHGDGLLIDRGGIDPHLSIKRRTQTASFGRVFYNLVCALDARYLDSRGVSKNRALMSTPRVDGKRTIPTSSAFIPAPPTTTTGICVHESENRMFDRLARKTFAAALRFPFGRSVSSRRRSTTLQVCPQR